MVAKNQLYQGSEAWWGMRNQPYIRPQMTPNRYPDRAYRFMEAF